MSDELVADNPAPEPTPVDNSDVGPANDGHDAPEQDMADGQVDAEQQENGGDGDDDLVAMLDGDADKPEAGPDLVDVEYNGKTYKVPADVKDGLMMRADHTRKTQELAEIRKAVEAERAAITETAEQFATVKAVEQEFRSKFGQRTEQDWKALMEQDPVRFQQERFEYDSLVQKHSQAQAALKHARETASTRQREMYAKAVEKADAALKERIPNWSLETARDLASHAQSAWGLSERELQAAATNPAHVEIMHKARQYDQLVAKRAKTKPKPEAEPVPKVKGGRPTPSGLDDRLSTDEWLKRRNKQLGIAS
jgi:hypothetical protein